MMGNLYAPPGMNGQAQYRVQPRTGMGVPQTMYQPMGMDRRPMVSMQQGRQPVQYGQQTYINAMDNSIQYVPKETKSVYV